MRLLPTILLSLFASFLIGCGSMQSVRVFDDEYDANLLLNVLKEHKIEAQKLSPEGERKGWTIEVAEKDLKIALDLMEDYCIGRKGSKPIENGTFSNSLEVEKAKNELRRKEEIETNLRALPSVRCVNVSINFPESNTISLKPYPAQASVIVQYIGEIPPISNDQIALQVSRSVPNLAIENVSVAVIKRPVKYDKHEELAKIRESKTFNNWLLAIGAGFFVIIVGAGTVLMIRKNGEEDDSDAELYFPSEQTGLLDEPTNLSENAESGGQNLE